MSYEAWRALSRLLEAHDQIEMALRPPGDLPVVSRVVLEEVLSHIRFARRALRVMSERADER